MNETTNMGSTFFKNDDVANLEPSNEAKVKPYTLKKLEAEHIIPMISILRKIGFNEIKACFSDEAIKKIIGDVVDIFKATSPENANVEDGGIDSGADIENVTDEATSPENANNKIVTFGLSVLPTVMDVVDVILCNIEKCENDIYKFLSSLSNLSVEEIRHLSLVDFTEMVFDVVEKEEFKDFFKVVSKRFK